KEQLVQTRNGGLRGDELRRWLQQLQAEFTLQMAAVDAEITRVTAVNNESSIEAEDPMDEDGRHDRYLSEHTLRVEEQLLNEDARDDLHLSEHTPIVGEPMMGEDGRDDRYSYEHTPLLMDDDMTDVTTPPAP